MERALVEGVADAYEFVLAERLHKSLGEVRAMPESEIAEWRAFDVWRKAVSEVS